MANAEMDPTLPQYVGDSCDWYDVPCHASSILEWLGDFLLWLPLKVYDSFLDAVADILNAIPMPISESQLLSAAGAISDMGYIAGLVNLKFGVATVFGCMLVRFLIRRIPFIG